MLSLCGFQLSWYIVSLILLKASKFSDACKPSTSTLSNLVVTGGSKDTSGATYFQCYEIAAAIVRCAKTGSPNACPSPSFITWNDEIYPDIVTCKDAFSPFGPYFFARTNLIYNKRNLAQEACEKYEGAKLATVKSAAELRKLQEVFEALHEATHYGWYVSIWIGLDYNPASLNWEWYDDQSSAALITRNMTVKNDYCTHGAGDCNCAVITPSERNSILAEYCDTPEAYTGYALCYGQKKTIPPASLNSGKYFKLKGSVNGIASPSVASELCEGRGGVLATIKTQAELLEVISLMGTTNYDLLINEQYLGIFFYWINLQYSGGEWRWQDDMTVAGAVTNWSPLQATPNSPGLLMCACIDFKTGVWYNDICTTPQPTMYGAVCMRA